MNQKEFSVFAAAIRTFYPQEKILPNREAIELWFQQLKDIPFSVAEVGLKKWVAVNRWSPSIADIRETCAGIANGEKKDWSEAWESVLMAIRMYGYYGEEKALNSLDEITASCIRRLGWRDMCTTENIGYFRTTFKTVYESLTERKRKEEQIPENLRTRIAEIIQESGRLEQKE